MEQKKIGNFLSKIRKSKNLTQEELAEKIGVNGKTISKWERGINLPDTIWLCKLSEILEVSVQDILNGEKTINTNTINNKLLINIMDFYKHKSNKKVMIYSFNIIIFFTFLITLIYTLNNFNKNKIFYITSLEDNFSINGYIIFNQKEELFILDSITYNDSTIGTNLEPIVKSYNIILKNKNEILYNSEYSINDEYQTLSNALKYSKINFSESNDKSKIITEKDIDNVYLSLSFTDINDNIIERNIKLKLSEKFSNNKLFY